jgi:hypothetical protein
MNWLYRAAFAGLPALLAVTAFAAELAPTSMPALDPQTATLIQQLDSDDYHTRQSAADQLTARGESIRPAMAALALFGKTPEEQSSAAAVIARLDKAIAESPTLITLHMKEANPRDIFAEIARQAHVDLPIWPEELWKDARFGPIPKLTLDIDQQPFWIALVSACQNASAHIQSMGLNREMTIMQGASNDMLAGPRCMSGLFIIVAESAGRNHQVSFTPGQTFSNNDSIQFKLYADPKAHLLGLQNLATLTLATDDKGGSLIGPGNAVPQYVGNVQAMMANFNAPLHYPNDGYTQVAKLKGMVDVTVAAKKETLEIPDLAAAGDKLFPIGRWTVQVNNFHVTGASGSFNLKIDTGGAPPNDIYTTAQNIRVMDAAGHALNRMGGGGSGFNNEINYQASFNSPAPIKTPVKMVWDVVTETKTQSIPFEFTDLPLPTP